MAGNQRRTLDIKTTTPERAARGAALTAAVGAGACGLCCVLPFALPAVALASAGGILAWLGGAQFWVTVLAGVIVATAWVWIAWRSARTKAKPASGTLFIMTIATGVLLLGVLWPHLEPLIIQALKG